MAQSAASRSARATRRGIVTVLALLVLVGALAIGVHAARPASAGYRTAVAASRPVSQMLSGVASVEAVSQAVVAFPAAGRVASVDVAAGGTVTAGQQLGTLDPTALEAAVHKAQGNLARARLTLTKALAGESTGTTRTTESGAAAAESTGAVAASGVSMSLGPTAGSGTGDDAVRAAQQRVLTAQRAVDDELQAASVALAGTSTTCAGVTPTLAAPNSPTPAPATTTPPSVVPAEPVTPPGPGSDAVSGCLQALAGVQTAQASVATAQRALSQAAQALDVLLEARVASAASGSTATDSTATSTGGSSRSGSGSGIGSVGSDGAAGGAPSSSQLIADQKAVDAAGAALAVAEQAQAQAVIVSPIAGTVAAVTVSVGDQVSAASTTSTITIIGPGSVELSTPVSVAKLPTVRVGQVARIQPDGSGQVLPGRVVAIGLVPSTTGSTTTYPVTIGFDDGTAALRSGTTASVAIITDSVADGLTVPTSALQVTGTRHVVSVLRGGKQAETTVEVGAVGPVWTQITGGIDAGTVVILADLGEPLPGSATKASTTGNSFTGRVPTVAGGRGRGTGTGGVRGAGAAGN